MSKKDLKEFRHTIASPLTTLLFALKEIEITTSFDDNYQQQLLQTIKNSALEMKKHFSLRDDPFSSHKEVFALRKIIQKTCSHIKKNYLLDIKYDARHLPTNILLYGDPQKLQIALTNLINNSAESYAYSVAHRPVEVKVLFDQYFNRLKIIVADHGLGINLFKLSLIKILPHCSFKNIRSGLGLYLTRKIIESEFAGKFCLASAKNYGTIAIINLHYTHAV